MSKVVIIDDSDPNIAYSGNWKALATINEISREYQNTVHRGDTNGQFLSYSFTGTGISVYGSSDSPASKGLPGVEFKLDSMSPQPINATGTLTYTLGILTTHQVLYRSPDLAFGTHSLTVTVTDSTINGPYLYFDFLTVTTGQDSVSGQVILDDRSEAIKYVPQWNDTGIPAEYLDTASLPPTVDSYATMEFNGMSSHLPPPTSHLPPHLPSSNEIIQFPSCLY